MAQLNNPKINGSLEVTSFISENGEFLDDKFGTRLEGRWYDDSDNDRIQYYICLISPTGKLLSKTPVDGLIRTYDFLDEQDFDYDRVYYD